MNANRPPWWRDRRLRAVAYQVLVVGAAVALGWYLVENTLTNLERRNIATGFGFLDLEASFGIGETPIPYSPADTYLRALLVGLLNTVRVAFLGIVLCTAIGLVFGIARLSTNWLVRRLAGVYVEGLRNVPVLLQLFFWYALITAVLPAPRQALSPVPGVFLSNRGLMFPMPEPHMAYAMAAGGLLAGLAAAMAVAAWARERRRRTGRPFPTVSAGIGLVAAGGLLGYLLGGAPTALDVPELAGFNFRGGLTLSPEFAALLAGLTFYTSAFVAEVVRGGIQSVGKGQTEAALSLGLGRGQVLRLVVLPQAMRVIVPPLTNQYLNLTKNSSLAVAIGYPDLVSITNTTINQTGQAIEGIALMMAVYLSLSLSVSGVMNWYNRRTRWGEGR